VFCRESWQNDIRSFRAVTVAVTVSFKQLSFFVDIDSTICLLTVVAQHRHAHCPIEGNLNAELRMCNILGKI